MCGERLLKAILCLGLLHSQGKYKFSVSSLYKVNNAQVKSAVEGRAPVFTIIEGRGAHAEMLSDCGQEVSGPSSGVHAVERTHCAHQPLRTPFPPRKMF